MNRGRPLHHRILSWTGQNVAGPLYAYGARGEELPWHLRPSTYSDAYKAYKVGRNVYNYAYPQAKKRLRVSYSGNDVQPVRKRPSFFFKKPAAKRQRVSIPKGPSTRSLELRASKSRIPSNPAIRKDAILRRKAQASLWEQKARSLSKAQLQAQDGYKA